MKETAASVVYTGEGLRMSQPQSSFVAVREDKAPSLWREIADGSAGVVVRVGVSLAMAPLAVGAALLGSFVLGTLVPAWSRGRSSGPRDELILCMLGFAGFAYMAGLIWIWTRSRHPLHALWRACVYSIAIFVVSCALVAMVEGMGFRDSAEFALNGAVVCVGGGFVLLSWVHTIREYNRRRPFRNPLDGTFDVRCPECNYAMVGLHQTRCPECGTQYTLDELLARQKFFALPGSSSSSDRHQVRENADR